MSIVHAITPLVLGALLALGAPSAFAQDAPPDEKAPIEIELPDASFGGTPIFYLSPNFEEEDYKDRPAFMAPKETMVVSKGKPVTSSFPDPSIGKLAQITDGDKAYAKSALVELGEGVQWVQVDLGAEYELYAVLVWHFHDNKRVYFDMIAKLSNDPEFGKEATVIYNNDYDNSAGMGVGQDKEYIENNKGRLIDAKGAKGRYIRVYGNGNTANEMNHFVEIEAWGKPVK